MRGPISITAGVLFWLSPASGLADVHYVSDDGGDTYPYTSPATAAREIQDGLDAAERGDTVRVLPGMYHALPDTSWVVGDGIYLIGSGPAATSLYGRLRIGDAGKLGGFRLILGGVHLHGLESEVSDCVFEGASVGMDDPDGHYTVRRCVFRFTEMWRYSIWVTYAGVTVSDCVFDLSDSVGDGAIGFLEAEGPVSIRRCRFHGCSQGIGGDWSAARDARDVRIVNCLFTSNKVGISPGGPFELENCTFYGNGYAVSTWETLYTPQVIKNSVLWRNTQGSILVRGTEGEGGYPAVTFSNVEGGYPGRGNIDADPMFLSPWPDGDFRPCAASPCIDAGDPFSDYSNEPEPNGGRTNMGAYGNTWEATTSELVDVDGDNLRDDWEMDNFGSLDGDGSGDADNDQLNDRQEYRYLSDPNSPDTDADSLLDGEEVSLGTDPLVADTDNDGTPDAKEVAQGTDPLDWTDAFTVLHFHIKDGYLYITYPTLPGYEYSLYSSNWPNGPFGFTVSPYRGRYGVLTQTDVLRLGPYNRFFRIKARPYP